MNPTLLLGICLSRRQAARVIHELVQASIPGRDIAVLCADREGTRTLASEQGIQLPEEWAAGSGSGCVMAAASTGIAERLCRSGLTKRTAACYEGLVQQGNILLLVQPANPQALERAEIVLVQSGARHLSKTAPLPAASALSPAPGAVFGPAACEEAPTP